MEQLILPSRFAWLAGAKPNEQVFVIEPCSFGYGTTIGNALRRVLLSSLPGAAVTAIRIEGANHEFSTVSHVQEDVLEILLNFKQLRLKVFSDEPVTLTLTAKGKREVTAADIAANAQAEVVNPGLHLMTLTHRDANLQMDITVRRGRGYSTTEGRPKEKAPIGTMAVDAIFTPVRNVGFRVENTRVGEITNYDRLLLTVETDGSMTPQEAVAQATKILMDHFALILNPSVPESAPTPSEEPSAIDGEPVVLPPDDAANDESAPTSA